MEQASVEPAIIEDLVKFGEDRGRLDAVARLVAWRLDRPFSESELATLERLLEDGAELRVYETVMNSSPDALAAWLGDPAAH